ncbi:hypothetical protein KAH55_12720 [bacterium]|nr:hypothetical protein [bacterium]
MSRLEFNEKSTATPVFSSDMLVAQQTATHFAYQDPGCLKCRHGVWVDMTDSRDEKDDFYRKLYCLKGLQYPHYCIENVNFSEPSITELA